MTDAVIVSSSAAARRPPSRGPYGRGGAGRIGRSAQSAVGWHGSFCVRGRAAMSLRAAGPPRGDTMRPGASRCCATSRSRR